MPTAKIAVTVDRELLVRLDRLVQERRFASRSQAVQAAIQDQLARLEKNRLARECAKLDPIAEQRLADEGLSADAAQWPEY
ncbi:MAG: ribbon-helix-helix protein, CopG family [Planctomycetia bacterium]|nr:ribbon-helix-helix protein, CopG family [Planctomycetia bacterium]